MLNPENCKTESTHLVFCPPLLRVSMNWAWRLTSGSLPGSILNTCPSQVCCLFITMYDMKFSLRLVAYAHKSLYKLSAVKFLFLNKFCKDRVLGPEVRFQDWGERS